MGFLDYLQQIGTDINESLRQELKKWNSGVSQVSSKLLPLTKTFISSSEGGKRLRGTLVQLGYDLGGGEKSEDILKISTAIEIFQTAILAHDDIIDKSMLRRGKKTLYQALGGDHEAIAQTICLGDIGFFIANRLIAETNFSNKNKIKALGAFSEMFINTVLGEMLDVKLASRKQKYGLNDVITIYKFKTAYYTIVYPLLIGAILADGDDKLLYQLKLLGENLGIAYQIQDDVLGVFGNEKELGKSVTSDVAEGKVTILYIIAAEKSSGLSKKVLRDYYGHGEINEEDLEKVKQLFISTGALDFAQNYSQRLVSEAHKIIQRMNVSHGHKKLLSEMADFLIQRQK